MAAKKSSKPASSLLIRVDGTFIEVQAASKTLAKSDAGGTGISWTTCCNEPILDATGQPVLKDGKPTVCGEKAKAPLLCDKHPDKNLRMDEHILKGYEAATGMVFLTPAQVKALKPKGDNTVRILHLTTPEEAGAPPAEFLAPHIPKMKALTPLDDDEATQTTWSTLHALIGGRVGYAEVMQAGKFFHALIYAAPGGALLMLEVFLRRDTYELPTVTLNALNAEDHAAIDQKAAKLMRNIDEATLDADPYRDAREKAILDAITKGTAPEVEAPAPAIPAKKVAVSALLG